MRVAIWGVLLVTALFGEVIKVYQWTKGETLLSYLQKEHIPTNLYYRLDREEKELADEIRAGVEVYEVRDINGTLQEALIPISEELQIHLLKDKEYRLEFIPVIYRTFADSFVIGIEHSPYRDIAQATGNKKLADEFINAFKRSIDFSRSIQKGDKLALVYEQKMRLGRLWGMPKIQAAMMEVKKKRHYLFFFDGGYYDEKGRAIESFFLKPPLKHICITSPFSLRRWHPVLHRYRAHLGVDFGARRGTPVMAAGKGRVVFVGRKGGYGKVVMIYHGSGYKTLYAHLQGFRKGLRVGTRVRQGEIIGYVGNTGLSTGPHLHFGLYKNGRPINPLRAVKITSAALKGEKLQEFQRLVEHYKKELHKILHRQKEPKRIDLVKENIVYRGGADAKR